MIDDELGPIDFLAVEFPGGKPTPEGFDLLLGLADRGAIRILDLEFVAVGEDGVASVVAPDEVPADFDLSVWRGASSGLLDGADLATLASEIQPGSVAVVVVIENRWVLGVVDAWRGSGARLIAEGGLHADEIVAALDATEPA